MDLGMSSIRSGMELRRLPHLSVWKLQGLGVDCGKRVTSVLVRDSYLSMFDTVWAEALSQEGRGGVIITGQPGIGKTLFNYYLLVRLLQRRQVVLFSPDGMRLFLFYHDGVYALPMSVLAGRGRDVLPDPISSSKLFLWTLFDIFESRGPVLPLVADPCFPVQTTLPDPIRYQTWEESATPLLTGLPLWTREELAAGLRCQTKYPILMEGLEEYCAYGEFPQSFPYPSALELLEERYGADEVPSADDALDYLLDVAIERFGYSARDVFGGVFNFEDAIRVHKSAFPYSYAQLQEAVSSLAKIRSVDDSIAYEILALRPVNKAPLRRVGWDVDFKSDWVARNVIRKLSLIEPEDLDTTSYRHISSFQDIPQARRLAERFLEPLVHRSLANCAGGFWTLTKMKPNGADPPHFTLDRDSPVPDDVELIRVRRDIIELKSIADLSAHLVDNNGYYIPVDPDFPLFDAIIIELNRAKNLAVLWILQISTSRRHCGSSLGYLKIREITEILKDELKEDHPRNKNRAAHVQATPTPSVQVRYLVVVPTHGPWRGPSQDLQWQFPQGWRQSKEWNNHGDNDYYLSDYLPV
ncbi:hypothetical protein M413DRAFT_158284 [Hebeloma cylindrosporum]|uniref:Uncharacterized protein n=1 Tax=Hebeloma cylindrosporum TaxID=76867 RepID=A0A0C3CBP8_HEBCY|nr:hypothetical protein M413DRAFT_158284 [Hebeloma cylindrosporum h7]